MAEKGAEEFWEYRGYRLSSTEFTTAMVHFYRGELSRANTWRSRLDATTNWAVLTTGAALSFTFSSAGNSHVMIPLNTLLITLFLFIEARRYRYYELWSFRVRLMETNFFGAMLAPPFRPGEEWAARLVESLLRPDFPVSFLEAFGRRFRRNYQWIYMLLALAWLAKVSLHPVAATNFAGVLRNAAVGPLSGEIVLAVGFAVNALFFALGWLSAGLRESQGEVLRGPVLVAPLEWLHAAGAYVGSPHLPRLRRHDELAYIITSAGMAEPLSRQIFERLKRGATQMAGRGMYTGEDRSILLVVIKSDQVTPLRTLVQEVDPGAFVIIQPTDQVLGGGFRPLD